MRPIFHQLAKSSHGHIFLSVLAYHLLHAIEQRLSSKGDQRSWPAIKDELESHRLLTVEVPDGSQRLHHIRLATKPTEDQKSIYRMLGLCPTPLPTKRYVAEGASGDEKD